MNFVKIVEYIKIPKHFAEAYPDAKFKVITPDNFEEFVLGSFSKSTCYLFDFFVAAKLIHLVPDIVFEAPFFASIYVYSACFLSICDTNSFD